MFKKRSKKGLSHVDWAMSLAIFLLYIIWFFIYVNPLFEPKQSAESLLDILETGVDDSLFHETERIRVFMPGSSESDSEPFIIPFDKSWDVDDISNSADHFLIDGNRMLFIGNLSDSRYFSIYNPLSTLPQESARSVIADEDAVQHNNFIARFTDYLLDEIRFLAEDRLYGFSVGVDDVSIGAGGSFTDLGFVAKYQRSDDINITSYVFADNDQVNTFFTSTDYQNHSVELDMILYNYTDFWFSPSDKGDVVFSPLHSCRYHESDVLDLSDGSSGLLLRFDKKVVFRFCANESAIDVHISFDLSSSDDVRMDIMAHSGGIEEVVDLSYPVIGLTENLDTVSRDQVSLLRNLDYGFLKQEFGFPVDNDFRIVLVSDTIEASYGVPTPEVSDVYARTLEGYLIDENFEQDRVQIMMAVW